jgi:hypothetical protein
MKLSANATISSTRILWLSQIQLFGFSIKLELTVVFEGSPTG